MVNVLAILGSGHLEYEALLLAQSFAQTQDHTRFKLHLAQPIKNNLWRDPPRSALTHVFEELGACVIDFECQYFGSSYPHGNKIEALRALPAQEPFLFFDTDTLLMAPLPYPNDWPMAASLRRSDTWPNLSKSTASRHQIWDAAYQLAKADFGSAQNHEAALNTFERYAYFNAGMVSGPCPHQFAQIWLETAVQIDGCSTAPLVDQPKRPWLDQIALPPALTRQSALQNGKLFPDAAAFTQQVDHDVSYHYRRLSLAFACAPPEVISHLYKVAQASTIKQHLQRHNAPRRLLFEGLGEEIRAKFHKAPVAQDTQVLRKALKKGGYWLR